MLLNKIILIQGNHRHHHHIKQYIYTYKHMSFKCNINIANEMFSLTCCTNIQNMYILVCVYVTLNKHSTHSQCLFIFRSIIIIIIALYVCVFVCVSYMLKMYMRVVCVAVYCHDHHQSSSIKPLWDKILLCIGSQCYCSYDATSNTYMRNIWRFVDWHPIYCKIICISFFITFTSKSNVNISIEGSEWRHDTQCHQM